MENNKGKRKVKEEPNEEKEEKKDDEEISKLVLGIMEGYSDSVIPPLSLFKRSFISESAIDVRSSSTKRSKAENVKERDRRVKMNDNFSLLEAIVPGLHPKNTKEKVIQRTIEYIKYLEEREKMLEKLKESSEPKDMLGLPLPTTTMNTSSSLSITVCGGVGFFGIQCPKRQGLVAQIFMVFQKHQAEVLAANVVVNQDQLGLTVTALVNGNESDTIEKIRREILML